MNEMLFYKKTSTTKTTSMTVAVEWKVQSNVIVCVVVHICQVKFSSTVLNEEKESIFDIYIITICWITISIRRDKIQNTMCMCLQFVVERQTERKMRWHCPPGICIHIFCLVCLAYTPFSECFYPSIALTFNVFSVFFFFFFFTSVTTPMHSQAKQISEKMVCDKILYRLNRNQHFLTPTNVNTWSMIRFCKETESINISRVLPCLTQSDNVFEFARILCSFKITCVHNITMMPFQTTLTHTKTKVVCFEKEKLFVLLKMLLVAAYIFRYVWHLELSLSFSSTALNLCAAIICTNFNKQFAVYDIDSVERQSFSFLLLFKCFCAVFLLLV